MSLLVVAALVVPIPSAGAAGTIAQTRAEIARLSSELAAQQRFAETTANAYDAAKVDLANITVNIKRLERHETTLRGQLHVTTHRLVVDVVRAYVLGAADAQVLSLFNQSVTSSDARRIYQDQAIGDIAAVHDAYSRQKKTLDATLSAVAAQRAQAAQQTVTMQSLLAQNQRNEAATQATLTSVTATLRTQIIAYEIQVGVAAAKAGNTSGEQQAVAAAASVGGQSAANQVLSAIQAAVPPVFSGSSAGSAAGLLAVKAAESQIGVPYVWGGETPGQGFDCSGLVQWAWAQAGFKIPRTTETQYPALRHVPLNALQPGDLLFYYNLDGDHLIDHVVMYVGSGPWGKSTIIAAASSGTRISFAPIFTFGLVGAARP